MGNQDGGGRKGWAAAGTKAKPDGITGVRQSTGRGLIEGGEPQADLLSEQGGRIELFAHSPSPHKSARKGGSAPHPTSSTSSRWPNSQQLAEAAIGR